MENIVYLSNKDLLNINGGDNMAYLFGLYVRVTLMPVLGVWNVVI